MNLVDDAFSYSERLMLIGHNPGVTDLLGSVLQMEQAANIETLDAGALAVVGFPAGFSRHARNGKLLQLVRRQDFSFN